jgi:hypothetical protein
MNMDDATIILGFSSAGEPVPAESRNLQLRLRLVRDLLVQWGKALPTPCLLCRLPDGQLELLPLQEKQMVGRDTLEARMPELSRAHFCLVMKVDRCSIEDQGSRNGTYLNDQPLTGIHPLNEGDIIQAGGGIFVFFSD